MVVWIVAHTGTVDIVVEIVLLLEIMVDIVIEIAKDG